MLRRIPKWLYVVVAVACFVGFHLLAKWGHESRGIVRTGISAVYWAQFIVPALLLVGAIFLGRGDTDKPKTRPRGASLRSPAEPGERAVAGSIIKVDPFRRMSEETFHELIKEFFVRNGFAVDPVPSGLGDGVDLMLRKNGKVFVAQHRHWREARVGVPMVREQLTVMQAARANGVYVITTGEFTYKAIQFAEEKNISLIDGSRLRRLVNRAKAAEEAGSSGRAPLCPLCAAEMLARTGTDQEGGQQRFWSCSNYPQCSGSREFEKT